MRDIRFRAWNKRDGKMVYGYPAIIKGKFDHFVEDITGSCYGVNMWVDDFMQFTGLLDKNGVEIYEGDRFEVTDGDGWVIGTHEAKIDAETLDIHPQCIGKILGNIYSNPELIK